MNKIHKLALTALLCLLAACATATEVTSTDLQNHNADREFLHKHAERGNPEAQLLLGNLYCVHEPAENKGMETVKWWTAAAEQVNSPRYAGTAAEAMEHLGKYYLSLYEDDNYDPHKSKPEAACSGRAAGDSDIPAAKKWLYACARSNESRGAQCEMALGHIYYRNKEYERAYFWYAAVLTLYLPPMTPAAATPGSIQATVLPFNPVFYGKDNFDVRNAKRAARHLSKAKVKEISDRALQWSTDRFNKYADKVEADILKYEYHVE